MKDTNEIYEDQVNSPSIDLGDYFPDEIDEFSITTRTDLMVDAILEQISDIKTSVDVSDIFSSLRDRYNFSILINEANTEVLQNIKNSMMNVYTTLFQEMVCTHFDISEETFEGYYHSINDIRSLAENAYDVFYMHRYFFILNLFKNIISAEKASFIRSYKTEIDKKDIETYVNRKKLSNFDNVVLIMSMENIVNDIMNMDFSSIGRDPFEMIIEGHEEMFIVERAKEYFGEVYIQDFIPKFISPLQKNSIKFRLISDLCVYFTEGQ